jgi:hypothetical protein
MFDIPVHSLRDYNFTLLNVDAFVWTRIFENCENVLKDAITDTGIRTSKTNTYCKNLGMF